jgi:alpha-L-fucosidase
VRLLLQSASGGSNCVINVGPTADGLFPDPVNERLTQIGAWMRTNGECVYGTVPGPFRKLPFDGYCTRRGNKLYLTVFQWPAEGLKLKDLETPVRRVRALQGGGILAAKSSIEDDSKVIHIDRPEKLDSIATVIEVELAGPLRVKESGLALEEVKESYDLSTLYAEIHSSAKLHGSSPMFSFWSSRVLKNEYVGYWTEPGGYVSWTITVPERARYRIEISYSCLAATAGSHFSVELKKGPRLSGTVEPTAETTDFRLPLLNFRMHTLGEMEIPSGVHTISVRIVSTAHGNAMNLHALKLTRVSA